MGEENVSFLYDIPVEMVVELGRTKITVGQLATLGKDDIVPLDKVAGQPLDVMVGGHLVGRGEVVVNADRPALRITELHRKAQVG